MNYKDEQSTAETAYKIIVNNKLCGKAIYFGDNLDNAYIIDLESDPSESVLIRRKKAMAFAFIFL